MNYIIEGRWHVLPVKKNQGEHFLKFFFQLIQNIFNMGYSASRNVISEGLQPNIKA